MEHGSRSADGYPDMYTNMDGAGVGNGHRETYHTARKPYHVVLQLFATPS